MSKESSEAKIGARFKKELMVVAFVVSLFGLFFGAITLNNWVKFGQYRSIANEVTEVVGGVTRRNDNWNCSLSSTNCPSVRLLKDVNFSGNEEARAALEGYVAKLKEKGYESGEVECANIDSVCRLSVVNEGKTVTISLVTKILEIEIRD